MSPTIHEQTMSIFGSLVERCSAGRASGLAHRYVALLPPHALEHRTVGGRQVGTSRRMTASTPIGGNYGGAKIVTT